MAAPTNYSVEVEQSDRIAKGAATLVKGLLPDDRGALRACHLDGGLDRGQIRRIGSCVIAFTNSNSPWPSPRNKTSPKRGTVARGVGLFMGRLRRSRLCGNDGAVELHTMRRFGASLQRPYGL